MTPTDQQYFRPPCDNVWTSSRLYFGSCNEQHYVKSNAGIQVIENVTLAVDKSNPEGPHIPPQSVTVAGCPDWSGSYSPEEVDTCETTRERNCYTQSAATMSFATCSIIGNWKAVQCRSVWHGMLGFQQLNNSAHACPVDHKYLSLTANVSIAAGENIGEWSSTTTVNAGSGKLTVSDCLSSIVGNPIFTKMYCSNDPTTTAGFLTLVNNNDAISLHFGGTYGWCDTAGSVIADMNTVLNGGSFWEELVLTAASFERTGSFVWTDDHIHYEMVYISYSRPDEESEWTEYAREHIIVDLQLNGLYTAETFISGALGMLDSWTLNDDVVYPWRNDDRYGTAPIVVRFESNQPISPGANFSCDYEDTSPYNGEVLGAPLPRGTDKHFQFDHKNHNGSVITSCGNWNVGNYENAEIPACAPRWSSYDMSVEGGFTHGASVSCIFSNAIWIQKWVEIIKPMDSLNFFRPCGADRDNELYPWAYPICGRVEVWSASIDDAEHARIFVSSSTPAEYLREGDAVDFVNVGSLTTSHSVINGTGSVEFLVSGPLGTFIEHTASYMSSYNAPAWYWNDSTSKGDFIVRRESYTASALVERTCTNDCYRRTRCYPSVAGFSNKTEGIPQSKIYGIVQPGFDLNHSKQWYGYIDQAMLDPFDTLHYVEARYGLPTNGGIARNETPSHFTHSLDCPPLGSTYASDDSQWVTA